MTQVSLKSKLIPNGPVVVKKDMPDEMVKVLIDGFNWVHKNDPNVVLGVAAERLKRTPVITDTTRPS